MAPPRRESPSSPAPRAAGRALPPDLSRPLEGLTRTVDPAHAGRRLDVFLRREVFRHSRARAQKLIAKGAVLINGTVASKPSRVLHAGDVVHVLPPRPSAPDVPEARAVPLAIVWEDEDLLLADKAAGVAVHPSGRFFYNTLLNALHARYRDTAHPDRDIVPRLVNRLDRETSGLVLVSKDVDVHAALSHAFAEREVRKEYRAIVYGDVDPPSGTIDHPLGRDLRSKLGMRQAVRYDGGLPARTDYETVRRGRGYTDLRLHPRTGRTHQLRVHMLAIGHPIVGDKLYVGGDERFGAMVGREPTEEELRLLVLARHALHAVRLRFRHPRTGEELDVHAALPVDMGELWGRIERGEVGPVDWRAA